VQLWGMEAVTRIAARQQADTLASAAAGDEIAFQRIIDTHHEDMRRVCQAISGDHAVADEAVQAAWLVAWKKLGKVHGPEHLRPWLVSVAVNEAKQVMRSRRRRAEIESGAGAAAEPGGVDPATGVAAVDLRAALSRLDPDDAALLAMRYVAGFDSNELGVATGKSPAATRQRLKRLLDRLREDLSDG
jgi:RNA polymerase sigma-70 factor (ECF subfamily)